MVESDIEDFFPDINIARVEALLDGIRTLQHELEAHQLKNGTILLLRLQTGAQPIAIGEPWTHPDEGAAYIY